MRIILIRHGESEGNIDDYAYVEKGDEAVGLTDKGWLQARGTGKFLNTLYKEMGLTQSPYLFVSSYQRTKETLSGINKGLDPEFHGEPHEDPLLVEQSFGVLAHIKHQKNPIKRMFGKLLFHFAKSAYEGTPFSSTTPFGESPKQMYAAAKQFAGTLERDRMEGKEVCTIVAHGATIKALMMVYGHLPMSAWKDLKTPGNGDVIVIDLPDPNSGEKYRSIRKVWDGVKGTVENLNPIEHIKRLTKETLPVYPEHLVP
ncbi:MAG: histidine phosphatase family protein [Bdellovibrionales bacterium]